MLQQPTVVLCGLHGVRRLKLVVTPHQKAMLEVALASAEATGLAVPREALFEERQ